MHDEPTRRRDVSGEKGADASGGADDDIRLRFESFEFDLVRDELRHGGEVIALRPKPLALLRYFLRRPQRLLSKKELLDAVWGAAVVTDDSLVQCVGELRAGLGADGPRFIRTHPRRGYLFDVEVREHRPRATAAPSTESPTAADVATTPSGPEVERRKWRFWRPVAAVSLLFACLAAAALWDHGADVGIDAEIARRHAIGVFGFKDLADPPSPPALRDGLSDDIAAQIGTRSGMLAIRGSASPASNQARPDVARALGEVRARWLLAGSIVRSGDQIRIKAQLTSADGGQVVWSDQFDYSEVTAANAADVSGESARRIVHSIWVRFAELHRARMNAPGFKPDAADLVLGGLDDIERRLTADDVRRSQQRFREALKADPRSVQALSGLGAALMAERYGYSGEMPPQDVAESERVAELAMKLAPNDSVSLIIWGNVLLFRNQADQALAVFERATQVAPTNANAHLRHALVLVFNGRSEQAMRQAEVGLRLGGRDPRIVAHAYSVQSQAAFAMGDLDHSYALAQRAIAGRPGYGVAYLMLATIDALRGRSGDAAAHMAQHRRLVPSSCVERFIVNNPYIGAAPIAGRARLIEGMRLAGLPEALPAQSSVR